MRTWIIHMREQPFHGSLRVISVARCQKCFLAAHNGKTHPLQCCQSSGVKLWVHCKKPEP